MRWWTTDGYGNGLAQWAGAVSWAVSLFFTASTAHAVTIELKGAAPERIENQRMHAVGETTLPGTPDTATFGNRLQAAGQKVGNPILIRIFKAEAELELWMQKDAGVYERFATYPVCNWSGSLGPKLAEGDKQTPEGFYTITRRQLHRIGRWPRSLNLGFPNVYDKSLARTGSYILVHGGCSSVGCFAMTNPVIGEIYRLTQAAIIKGQKHVPVHVFPFRMTRANLNKHATSEWQGFWQNLKEGFDTFEETKVPPNVRVCDGRYHFDRIAPGEVGAPRPLKPCGETIAAVLALEQYYSLASSHPVLAKINFKTRMPMWTTAASHVPAHLSGAFEIYHDAMQTLARAVAENAKHPPARRMRLRTLAQAARKSYRYRCNPSLASCRRYMALQRYRLEARIEAASSIPPPQRIKTARSGRRTRAR